MIIFFVFEEKNQKRTTRDKTLSLEYAAVEGRSPLPPAAPLGRGASTRGDEGREPPASRVRAGLVMEACLHYDGGPL